MNYFRLRTDWFDFHFSEILLVVIFYSRMKNNESNEEEFHPYKTYIDKWTMFDCSSDIIHREQCTLAKQINESFSTEIAVRCNSVFEL